MRIKVSDYIFQFLESKNIDTAFSVSGGAAAHLLESIRKSNIKYIPNYHEQASAMSAEGYTRITNKPALVLVTNGPGSSNTLTGVIGAYQDSIPMFIISGQVPTSQTSTSEIRQLGVQELRIIPIVKNFTNYATQVKDPKQIKYILELAWEACMEDRRGPVWLDIPLDVQNAYVETDDLVDYRSPSINNIERPYNFDEINDLISKSNVL
jgi:acetolactate synthase I/II/III large subunit